nr:hypothetical protein [uncultured Fluviicola sp.]
MKTLVLIFYFTLIDLLSFGQVEYTPYGSNNIRFRGLTITSISNKTAHFTYYIKDSNNVYFTSGELKKSKVILYNKENKNSERFQRTEELIKEIQSKKSHLYFDFLSIALEKYPDSLVNLKMFNNYFKPLNGLNFTHLTEIHFTDESVHTRSKTDSVIFNYRRVRNFDLAEMSGYTLVNNTYQTSSNTNHCEKIDLSKIDFIKHINLTNLKNFKCSVPFFDSGQLMPLLKNCNVLEFNSLNDLNNQNILFFDSIKEIGATSWNAPNVEFWNNSYKTRSYKEQQPYYPVDDNYYYWYFDPYDFPITYFFNCNLTPSKKMEWFNSHISSDKENYSGDYLVKCENCTKRKKYSEEFESVEETKDTLLIKGKLLNGKPVGSWLVREEISVPFSVLDFDKNYTPPNFPQNGSWSFNYLNGQTAIEGDFKDGKKTGKWYFYDFYGKLLMVKSFSEDQLIGLSEFSSFDDKREVQLYLHSNGDIVYCISEYSFENGIRKLVSRDYCCLYTNEKGTTRYEFTEGAEIDNWIYELSCVNGTDRMIERNTKEFDEIKNNLFFKFLDLK